MPADSDLPRRWRPLGTRFAAWFLYGALLLISGASWVLLGEDIRSRIHPASGVIVLILYAMGGAVVFALARCRVDATEQGLVVINGYRRRELAWAQVLGITMPVGAPWAVLDLADGTSVSVIAIQASDGPRARDAVHDIRALIDRAS